MRSAASTEPPVASSSKKRGAKNSGKDPPPLSADALELFNGLVGDTIKMLAEKQINTNVFSPPEAKAQRKMRPNEQNMKNRDRQVKFSGDIERAKAEDAAWSGLDKFYNSHHAAVMSEVEHRRQASAKAKGKQRAENVDAWGPRVDELPSRFRAVDLARKVLLDPPDPQSPLFRTWDEDAYRIDDLHQLLHASVKAASVIETDLDRRFALLNLTLQARSSSLPPPLLHASTTPLSAYLPARVHPHSATDPQDLFRALSRIDMVRKPAQVGDAARRAAREVQRAQAEGMPNERRLTGVPPPTPRKPPGTPRRATTPGRGR
ncbi:hypothetical protein OF83DRAFT_1070900 [Amylostereum chailletii]|nr:hypothetical protein OF83DRAFT_1070900 [Amylostereum chailletii]